ncbi:hypothetical protein OU997_05185 [Pseudomonas sp. SL4(2022)]|uniref:hypothetical protein n=1 Tax=Pseudomonas sp. SL4(2022) TaxID=2994661 RepID=UPI0022712777|nr:hypothetical protein [Pseudomonas sp. SL4(2022)]WAC45566.1 hypothetical protein OU997_05185 [Pseudomonas sp. SL4(2022)]
MRHVGLRSDAKDIVSQEQVDVWALIPIGSPFPLWTHLAGVTAPPTDNANYRYIKLTASDSYNTGVLTGESVSGSAPQVQATAVINDPGSPINGQTIRLINTERRVLRAGQSGVVEADDIASHAHTVNVSAYSGTPGTYNSRLSGGFNTDLYPASGFFGINNSGGSETRAKNIGADFYVRIR